jgi:hypothetical protein
MNFSAGKWTGSLALLLLLAVLAAGCGEKETPYNTNLLKNSSFEAVRDGIPRHWRIADFRGLEGESEVEYGIDNTTAADGLNSWYFKGDPGTRRWYVLTQEVEVRDITHVRLTGWMQLDQVRRWSDQYAQCNYLLTFFDENHNRFQELRFADKRTRFKIGTLPWYVESHTFRVPRGTRYVAVSCILGCDGKVWFDNVELSVPEALDWQSSETENFTFYWLEERPFPVGSVENQQRLFDYYAGRLGIPSSAKIGYYLYPDTARIRDVLSLKGYQYISWDDFEIHTINPNENHEIIHFITDVYGVPPKAIAEGTVFWLHGNWMGGDFDKMSARYLADGVLPPISQLIDYNRFASTSPQLSMPAASSFVKFIVDRWGTEKLIELYKGIAGVNAYDSFAQAFERVYGISCADVEEQWRLVLSRIDLDEQSGAGSQQ